MSNRLLQRIVGLLSLTFLLVPLGAAGIWFANRESMNRQGSSSKGVSGFLADYVYRPIGNACGISTERIAKKLTASQNSPFGEPWSGRGTVMPNNYLRDIGEQWKVTTNGLAPFQTSNKLPEAKKSRSRSAKRR